MKKKYTESEIQSAIKAAEQSAVTFSDDSEVELAFDLPAGILQVPEVKLVRDKFTAKAKLKVRLRLWEKGINQDDNASLRMVWTNSERLVFDDED